jgi:uncharacterized protein YbcC (UPF0753/DUF2309 family)
MTGFLGVMEGASSDLRTGLPRQMIEIHEAMRLQVIVEAKTDILTEIYKRQPPLQELIGKGWLLLSATLGWRVRRFADSQAVVRLVCRTHGSAAASPD